MMDKKSAPKESVDERKTNIYLNRRKKSAILAKGMDCATKVFYCIVHSISMILVKTICSLKIHIKRAEMS